MDFVQFTTGIGFSIILFFVFYKGGKNIGDWISRKPRRYVNSKPRWL